MEPNQVQPTHVSSRRVMLVMMSLSTLYNYLYSMTLSSAYGLMPVLGGALFMSGAVASTYAQTFMGENRKYLSRRMRVAGTLILLFILLFSLALFAVYPIFRSSPAVWALFAVVLALTMRAILGQRLVARVMGRHLGRTAFLWLFFCLQAIPAGVTALLFFRSLPQGTAWQALAGYGLSILLESYTLWRERGQIAPEHDPIDVDPAAVERITGELRSVHA